MREREFRAWDGEKMWDDVCCWGKNIILAEAGTNNGRPDGYLVKVKAIMEFTGLLDKNKKKIFEGDILEYLTSKGLKRTAVEYYVDEAYYIPFGNHDAYSCHVEDVEVIGNIYSNPEIFKGWK